MTWPVKRDSSCVRGLLWRVEPPEDLEVEQLIAALLANGLTEHGTPGVIRHLSAADETAVIVVPKTRRVQIRLSYLVDPSEREAKARFVAASIAQWAALPAGIDP
ncbi:MAG: hypothetical protein JNK45_06870 [Myxococcales bacterium]|nr:hypothetical protein [Myxococcales bacterium]